MDELKALWREATWRYAVVFLPVVALLFLGFVAAAIQRIGAELFEVLDAALIEVAEWADQ